MSVRGTDGDLLARITALEDQVRQLQQGVGLSSLTFRRVRLTSRDGNGKIELVVRNGFLEIYDLVSGGDPLKIAVTPRTI